MDPLDQLDALPQAIYWTADKDGKIQTFVGGALRLIGLTRGSMVGSHVTELSDIAQERLASALDGMSGISIEYGQWPAARTRRYVVAWGPYHEGSKLAGLLCLAMDVTGLKEDAVEEVRERLDMMMPVLEDLARAQTDALRTKAEEYAARKRMLEDRAERRWVAIRDTSEWLASKLGTPVAIVFTALAMWAAGQLGVLEAIIAYFTPAP